MGELVLEVSNFGPIKKAENIPIRDLTLFIGPNGTGKSFMAMLLYALDKTFEGLFPRSAYSWGLLGGPEWALADGDIPWIDSAELPSPPAGFAASLGSLGSGKKLSSLPAIEQLCPAVVPSLSRLLGRAMADAMKVHLHSGFSCSTSELVRFGEAGGAEIVLAADGMKLAHVEIGPGEKLSVRVDERGLETLVLRGRDEAAAKDDKVEASQIYTTMFLNAMIARGASRTGLLSQELTHGEVASAMWRMAIQRCARALRRGLGSSFPGVSGIRNRSYYLPASRAGFVASYRTLAQAQVRTAKYAGIGRETIVQPLPGPAAEFLSEFIELRPARDDSDAGRGRERPSDLLTLLENGVLRGKPSATRDHLGIPAIEFRDERNPAKALPEHRIPSGIAELIPLHLFLKYKVRPGDRLTVEEPEAHLHPGAMLDLAAVFAMLANVGTKVLLTTHSDFLLSATSAMLEASGIPEQARKDLDIPVVLKPSQLSVVRFDRDGNVHAVESSDGIPGEEFSDVVESLYNLRARMQNLRAARKSGKRRK